jgi:hypothetical protein
VEITRIHTKKVGGKRESKPKNANNVPFHFWKTVPLDKYVREFTCQRAYQENDDLGITIPEYLVLKIVNLK